MANAPNKTTRPGFAFWTAVLLIVGVLYVASSGPTLPLMVHAQRPPRVVPFSTMHPRQHSKFGMWGRLYAPLLMISYEPWGRPLRWYWSLFPIGER